MEKKPISPNFFSAFMSPIGVATVFSNVVPKYDKVVENGEEIRKEVGEFDQYAFIQEQLSLTTLSNFFEISDGKLVPVNQQEGVYADVSQIPNSPVQLITALEAVRSRFDMLPAEAKIIYGDDFANFVNGNIVNPPVEKPVASQKEGAADGTNSKP